MATANDATAILLLYYCCTTAVLLLYYCTAAVLLLYYCYTTAILLLLYYGLTTAVLLPYYQNHSATHSILSSFSTSSMLAFDPLHACCPQTPCDESDKHGTSNIAHHIHIGIWPELRHHLSIVTTSPWATNTSTCAGAIKCAPSIPECNVMHGDAVRICIRLAYTHDRRPMERLQAASKEKKSCRNTHSATKQHACYGGREYMSTPTSK